MAQSRKRQNRGSGGGAKACGLCGKRSRLTRTPCCREWICDDEDRYVVFSYARNSCYRNHSHYTLCGVHHHGDHPGNWRTCPICRDELPTELYVHHGTNEYNFEKLENPPSFEPSHCDKCGAVVSLVVGGYARGPEGLLCSACSVFNIPFPPWL